MSGICGMVLAEKTPNGIKERIETMRRFFSRAGIIMETLINSKAGLGSAWGIGSQAGFFKEDACQVVCDAEIYNSQELRHLLERKGHRFQTSDDAELIASLYLEYGSDGIQRIRGIFSFAIWDNREEILFLATDRFGVKPLHYSFQGQGFLFGSNVRCLSRTPVPSEEIDPQAIFNYLFFSFVSTPRTIFKDIQKLPPGHFLFFKNGEIEVMQYWDMSYPEAESTEVDFYKDSFKRLIEESVKIHIDYNGLPLSRIGAFLSGGTDSSTVAGMICRLTGQKIKTFSIGFGDESYNEIAYARIASKHFGTEHHEYFVTPQDLLQILPSVVKEYDEPFGNASVIPTYYCAKMAEGHGIKVLFSGDGGDELFAGNSRYQTDQIFEFYQKVPAILRNWMIEPIFFGLPFVSFLPLVCKIQKYIRRSNIPNPDRFFSYEFLSNAPLQDILEEDFLKKIDPLEPISIARDYYNQVKASSNLNRLLYIDLKLAISDNDLRKVNRMAELAGIDVRYPLLDYRIAEFSGEIPVSLKMKGQRLRYIFKEALKDFLPPEIIHKQKHGFGLPFSLWLKNNKDLQAIAYNTLLDGRILQRGYFKKSFLKNLVASHQADTTPYYGTLIWVFMMLELWHREYIDGTH